LDVFLPMQLAHQRAQMPQSSADLVAAFRLRSRATAEFGDRTL